MRGNKVLIVRLAAIGDVVMASTVIGRIRERAPNATIHWLCGNTAASLVEQFEGVDEVIRVDEQKLLRGGFMSQLAELGSVWRRVASRGFSDVLLLHVDRRYRALVLPILGAEIRSLTRRDAHGMMNPVPGRYLGDEYARLVDDESGAPIVRRAPLARLRSTSVQRETVEKPRIAIVPGGTKNVLRESSLKRWPAASYASVARALLDDGCEVTLVGDANDAWVQPSFDGLAVRNLIGLTSLTETAATLAECDLVISHDTGPMHLARLVRTPVLALFGPTPPAHFAPQDEHTTVLWGGEHLACRPCYDGREFADCTDNRCMQSISPDVVIRTARTILARAGATTRARSPQPTLSETSPR